MDNLPKNNSDGNNPSTGEVYNSSGSSYQDATAIPENQPVTPQAIFATDQPNSGNNTISIGSVPPPGSSDSAFPPPHPEDKRKKYIIMAIISVFLIILLSVVILRLGTKEQSKPPEKITLNYWGLWEDSNIFQTVFDEYKKTNPNVTVKYNIQDKQQYRERLQAAIDRGEGPDIYRFHNTWIPMIYTYLAPMPKDIYSDAEYEKTFYPVTKDNLKLQGNYYGIPLMIDGLVLFYNEDILKNANVPVPATWDDVQKAVPKLTVKEKGKIVTSAIALGTAENIEHFSDILGLMFLQNRTKPLQSLFSCADKDTIDCSVQVLKYYRSFAEPPNNTWDDTLDNSIVAFSGGKVAMIIAPSWQAFTIKKRSENNPINFKTAVVPQLPCPETPCAIVNWASYWVEGVSSKSKNQAAAWEFLKYLSQASTMQKFYAEQVKFRKLFGEPYSRVELGKTLSDNPYVAPLITSAKDMKSFYLASRTYDGDTGINSLLIKYLKDAVNSLSQGVSFETALKTADDGFKQVFSRFNIASSAQ